MADRDQHPSREDEIRHAVFGQVDLQTAELEIVSSIYDGFAAAITVKGQPRTIALTREYGDAVQLMAMIERSRFAQLAASGEGPPPVRGEIRVIDGNRCRFIERELEGDKWEVIGPAAASDSETNEMAALRAQPPAREDAQPVGWRSIDSAPKDGTVIDVWRAEGGKDTVHWGKPHHDCGEAGGYCDSDWHSIRAPGWVCNTFDEFLGRNHNPFTHWKPLDKGPDAAPSPAITHPAPDALRVAVEALDPFARIASEGVIRTDKGHVTVTTCAEYFHAAVKALATLQAEQGAK